MNFTDIISSKREQGATIRVIETEKELFESLEKQGHSVITINLLDINEN